jgi:hypothetical protein
LTSQKLPTPGSPFSSDIELDILPIFFAFFIGGPSVLRAPPDPDTDPDPDPDPDPVPDPDPDPVSDPDPDPDPDSSSADSTLCNRYRANYRTDREN